MRQTCTGLEMAQDIWVVGKIMIPFWLLNIIRHHLFRGPQKGTRILRTTQRYLGKSRASATPSTPQLHFKILHIPTNRDHKALNRSTLGGLGPYASLGSISIPRFGFQRVQIFKGSGLKNHTLNSIWDQRPYIWCILGTWTLWGLEFGRHPRNTRELGYCGSLGLREGHRFLM